MTYKYRVWFDKTDAAKYISHLDLMRTMTRLLRQSKLPIWYTEGFNPHPFLTFAAPLALGVEALNEPFDVKMAESLPCPIILQALQAVQTPSLSVKAVTLPLKKFHEITSAEFELVLRENHEKSKIEDLFKNEIVFTKPAKIKRGKRIAEKEFTTKIDLKAIENRDGETILKLILPQGQTNNLNINLVTEYLAKNVGANFENIRRLMLFTDDKPLQ